MDCITLGALSTDGHATVISVNLRADHVEPTLRNTVLGQKLCGMETAEWHRGIIRFSADCSNRPAIMLNYDYPMFLKASLVYLIDAKGMLDTALERRHEWMTLVVVDPDHGLERVCVGFLPKHPSLVPAIPANDNDMEE